MILLLVTGAFHKLNASRYLMYCCPASE